MNRTSQKRSNRLTLPFVGSLGKIGDLQVKRVESESGFSCWEWRIPDIHGLPAKSYFSYYKSDSFQVLGESWHLTVRPDTASIYVHLVKEESFTECSVKYSLYFKKAGDTLPNEFTEGLNFIFSANECQSPSISCALSKLRSHGSNLAPLGVVTIVCLLKKLAPYPVRPESDVVKVPASTKKQKDSSKFEETSTHEQLKICTEKLSHDLSELMLSGKYSDFTVRVKGEEFRLHRAILSARTPVFQAMFEHNMAEKKTGRVSVDDCQPDEFRAFVRYVYTGRTTDELHADVVFGLFALADKYQVDELKSACLAFVRSTLSAETFCDVVQLALKYDDEELLEQATDFLSRRTTAVMKTDKWKNFLAENHMQANELLMKALDRKQH